MNKRAHLMVPRWVFLVYALGMTAGFFFEPIGLLTFCWLFWHQRARLQKTFQRESARLLAWRPDDRPLWAWLPLVVIAVLMFWKGGFTLLDDFARHVNAYRHGFDYSQEYLYADILNSVHISPWVGFEWFIGQIHSTILSIIDTVSSQATVLDKNVLALGLTQHIMVALAFIGFGIIFVPIFQHAFRFHPMPHVMTGLALTLILWAGIGVRLQQARPEVFLMLAMFSVWRLPPRVWVLIMMLVQPLYWLGWLYSAGALFITQWRWTQKLVAISLILGAYVLFWHSYYGLNTVIDFILMTQRALETRMVHAGENMPPVDYLFSLWGIACGVLLVMVFYGWGEGTVKLKERRTILALMVIWVLSNQIRYAVYCVPCLAYLWAKQSGYNQLPEKSQIENYIATKGWYVMGALAGALIFCLQTLPIEGFLFHLPRFKTLSSNARVLTFFNPSTFILPALYPGIKIAPAMEVGFSNRPLQQFLKDRWDNRGRETAFECEALQKELSLFTHVIEASPSQMLPNQSPPCLKLEETYGAWRLWRVVPNTVISPTPQLPR